MFDYIFITHLPSFYKTNLYNELSKKLKICVIFVGKGSDIRTSDFTAGKINFDYHFLSEASFENRSVIKSLFKLYFLLKKIKYNMIAVGGWELPEFWLTILTSHKKNNALVLESSIEESVHKGLKGFIKKLFLNRLSTVFASGSSQKQLLDQLNYKGSTFITKGVGIINKNTDLKKSSDFNNNFLYVGRLSEEKNLPTLIQVFNNIPEYKLTIVGSGHLEGKLKKLAKPNINFISHVKNDEMYKVYLENDVLVLPSISETWGLVIEEAIYFGLPVIISNKVGCGPELIRNHDNGIIFDVLSSSSLSEAIIEIAKNYKSYHDNTLRFNINNKDNDQVKSYITALNSN